MGGARSGNTTIRTNSLPVCLVVFCKIRFHRSLWAEVTLSLTLDVLKAYTKMQDALDFPNLLIIEYRHDAQDSGRGKIRLAQARQCDQHRATSEATGNFPRLFHHSHDGSQSSGDPDSQDDSESFADSDFTCRELRDRIRVADKITLVLPEQLESLLLTPAGTGMALTGDDLKNFISSFRNSPLCHCLLKCGTQVWTKIEVTCITSTIRLPLPDLYSKLEETYEDAVFDILPWDLSQALTLGSRPRSMSDPMGLTIQNYSWHRTTRSTGCGADIPRSLM